MATDITTTIDLVTVKRIIKSIPNVISGKEKDPHGLHNRFWGAVALSMFKSMSKAFDTKSQGQQDDLGQTWHDISEQTKAYSRPAHVGDLPRKMRRGMSNPNTMGLLNPGEYKIWKGIWAGVFNSKKADLGDAEAKIEAGKVAWGKLKAMGAQTKINILGSRDLLILRDTDKLFRSFLPGNLSKKSYRKYNRDQIYEVRKGEIKVGTKVEYAEKVFEDRPLWAEDISPWIKKAVRAGSKRISEHLKEVL
jgi:hypothetical protein